MESLDAGRLKGGEAGKPGGQDAAERTGEEDGKPRRKDDWKPEYIFGLNFPTSKPFGFLTQIFDFCLS